MHIANKQVIPKVSPYSRLAKLFHNKAQSYTSMITDLADGKENEESIVKNEKSHFKHIDLLTWSGVFFMFFIKEIKIKTATIPFKIILLF